MITFLAAAAMAITLVACSSPGMPSAPPAGKAALPEAPPPPLVADDAIVCPADVKACPDGSFVSRNPDQGCAFARCPGETQQ